MSRDSVRVILLDAEQHDDGFPDFDKLDDMIAWATALRDSVPPEFRDKINVCFDSVCGWEDSHYAHIQVWYFRPETDEEMAVRTAAEHRNQERAAAIRQREELALLAALKAKYETSAG